MGHTVRQASPPNSHPLWRDGIDPLRFPALEGEIDCDIAIIGGGFSGLWSAYHLIVKDPSLRICVFEAEEIGFGASGRNGGWVSADYPVDLSTLSRRYPKKDIPGFAQLLIKGVDEIGLIAEKISPRANFRRAGALLFATNRAQMERLRSSVDRHHHLISRDEVEKKISIPSALGGLFTEHCATINPRRLLLDLASELSARGVAIHQRSRAERRKTPGARALMVNGFHVRSEWTIMATEAFTPRSRQQIPLYSLMIATRSLTDVEREAVKWSPGMALAEATNNVNYAQMTGDFRLAVGGRGARYPFASRMSPALESNTKTHQDLSGMVQNWFPQLTGIETTHHWGGAIAIRPDWESRICVDRSQALAHLGGYVGDGMTMSFIAARAVATQILTGEKMLESMPIPTDCHRSARWPIEPFRYPGANSLISMIRSMDRAEEKNRQPRVRKMLTRWIGK